MNYNTKYDTWEGCYRDQWKGTLLDVAFCHPAKFSKSLIFRIIKHAKEEGFIKDDSY